MTDLIDLNQLIKASYEDRNKQENTLQRFGYVYDPEISDKNNHVYYHPEDNELIQTVRGTSSLSDIGTDYYLARGKLKDTQRFKDSLNIYNKSKQKYNGIPTKLIGHSLGGGIVSELPSDDIKDKVISVDKGSAPFHRSRKNENSYRTSGDLVSIANINSSKTKTLKQYNKSLNPYYFNSGINYLYNGLLSHKTSNLKNENIFV